MSHTNSTPNYGLPQFVTTDKPFWLTDVNTAYSDIDLALKNNADTATTAGNNAVQALSDASAAATTASGADAKASGAIASISDQFDTTATYVVGDIVIYNNLLYKCDVAVTTPGPWTGSANWERITVEQLSNELNARLSIVESNMPVLGNEVVLNASDPFITYRKYGHTLFLYINTQNLAVTGDTTFGNLPVDCTPLMGNREYRENGFIAVDSENNNRIWARNVPTWTTCTMSLPI